MNKNKLTPVATPGNSKKLRNELRRVMSDRVMKITRCSQQQNVEKVKQRMAVVDLLTSSMGTPMLSGSSTIAAATGSQASSVVQMMTSPDDFTRSQPATMASETVIHAVRSQISPSMMTPKLASDLAQRLVNKDPSPLLLAKLGTTKLSPQLISAVVAANANAALHHNNVTKISLQPIKQFDLKDKESLIKHIKAVYEDAKETNGSLVMAAQSITNSINHYARANQLDFKTTCAEILKENMFQTNIQLRQKYQNQPGSEEKLKLEAQLQVLLQIEHYIVENSNPLSNKIKVDEDWVWEIANSIRWISQNFRDKFKIEKFLLGEIDSNYIAMAPDFIVSLKEELGYDNHDTDSESSSSSDDENAEGKMVVGDSANSSVTKDEPVVVSKLKLESHVSINASMLSASLNYTRDETSASFSLVNSLFEDVNERNSFETDNYDYDEPSQSQKTSVEDDDPLNSFIRKKPANRFTDTTSSSMRSIVVVQPRKRMRLKMRSPYKSPSKAISAKRQAQEQVRRSPRIKEKQVLLSDSPSGKRRKSYLITDTPDHKQNATILTTRQEKVRKRFSLFQQQSPLPVIPDTPVKKA